MTLWGLRVACRWRSCSLTPGLVLQRPVNILKTEDEWEMNSCATCRIGCGYPARLRVTVEHGTTDPRDMVRRTNFLSAASGVGRYFRWEAGSARKPFQMGRRLRSHGVPQRKPSHIERRLRSDVAPGRPRNLVRGTGSLSTTRLQALRSRRTTRRGQLRAPFRPGREVCLYGRFPS